MDTPDKRAHLLSLRRALEALSVPPLQPALFPEAVATPNELAVEYDNWASVVRGNYEDDLSDLQRRSLAAIDRRLSELSEGGLDMWSHDALAHDAAWQEVRRLAVDALDAFADVDEEHLPAEPLR